MKYVLVKEGEYRRNAFSDFAELVNQCQPEQVGFYMRMDPTLRLVRNMSDLSPEMPLAVAHFQVNPAAPNQLPKFFRPVNTELMFKALRRYPYVIFGLATKDHMVMDVNVLTTSSYYGRTKAGRLINLETGEYVNKHDQSVTFCSPLVSMIKVQNLPVYYLILDNRLVNVTSGFDYVHEQSKTTFKLISQHDGSYKDALFKPIIRGCVQVGQILHPVKPGFTIDFNGPNSIVVDSGIQLTEEMFEINTNIQSFNYEFDQGQFTFSPPVGDTYYIKIKFLGGPFFECANPDEALTFDYMVVQ